MDHELLKLASQALKKASLNEVAKDYILSNLSLFQLFKKAGNPCCI
jgi:hypothetical protein